MIRIEEHLRPGFIKTKRTNNGQHHVLMILGHDRYLLTRDEAIQLANDLVDVVEGIEQ